MRAKTYTAHASIRERILQQHAGRDPERLAMKLELIAGDPFDFFRGTCVLFFETLPETALLRNAPAVLTCGDLHLENFGSFRGANRLVNFDLNDFDEACVAPLTLEMVRFLASVHAGAASLKLSEERADQLCETFLAHYSAVLASGKPAWLERATTRGMVNELLTRLKRRHRGTLLNERTVLRSNGERALRVDGRKILATERAEREHVRACLKAYARTQAHPEFYEPLDIGRRVAGNGSLGLPRYIVLTEGRGEPDGNFLLDLKAANPSALAPRAPRLQPRWATEGMRVVAIQQVMQAMSPALLAAVPLNARSFILKELQPSTDKLDLEGARGKLRNLTDVVQDMARLTAWAQLRGAARYGAAPPDDLMKFGARTDWHAPLLRIARAAAQRNIEQWKAYRDEYRKAGKIASGAAAQAAAPAKGAKTGKVGKGGKSNQAVATKVTTAAKVGKAGKARVKGAAKAKKKA
jgi:uncharacterized protein (DUF2252 family)